MDDLHTSSSAAHAARSAEALRELEERAHAAWVAQRDQMSGLERQLSEQLDALAETLAKEKAEEAAADVARLRQELGQTQADGRAWAERQKAWDAERAALESARDELAASLAAVREQLKLAQEQADDAHQNQSLQQKFELALEDVHRLRGRVADLEQELARRPETEEADSVELVHLRAERDALAERVEQLEKEPADRLDADAEGHLADLERRFELAVEDVRELKKKNSQLEAQLAEAATKAVARPDAAAMDWESQKRRLLASLENEGDGGDPARQKELATMEGTIRITDEVVAQKDEEIAELKERLTSLGGGKVAIDRERELAINRLVDEDEVIQEHRKRIAQLEREMEEKLRAAELELSVERAKLAREKAGLASSRLELEAVRQSREEAGGQAAAGTPKRRWLSKLGLGSEEEGT